MVADRGVSIYIFNRGRCASVSFALTNALSPSRFPMIDPALEVSSPALDGDGKVKYGVPTPTPGFSNRNSLIPPGPWNPSPVADGKLAVGVQFPAQFVIELGVYARIVSGKVPDGAAIVSGRCSGISTFRWFNFRLLPTESSGSFGPVGICHGVASCLPYVAEERRPITSNGGPLPTAVGTEGMVRLPRLRRLVGWATFAVAVALAFVVAAAVGAAVAFAVAFEFEIALLAGNEGICSCLFLAADLLPSFAPSPFALPVSATSLSSSESSDSSSGSSLSPGTSIKFDGVGLWPKAAREALRSASDIS
mmetsp:Transcript_18004/g.25987  ORF Transcript_18004/g.25987 Transcript_18004/m.25987 type:complete len:307 (+) Transcript_18004:123-1043(+)